MQACIPPELRAPAKTVVPTTGFDKAPDMEHHDPSNVILYEGQYYVGSPSTTRIRVDSKWSRAAALLARHPERTGDRP